MSFFLRSWKWNHSWICTGIWRKDDGFEFFGGTVNATILQL
jgi:hypothetical protein